MARNSLKVVVTGGAKGIGRAVTEAFLKKGACVAFLDPDRGQGAVQQARLGKKAHWLDADVADPLAIETSAAWLKSHFRKIDVLVNNAGIGSGPWPSLEDWDRVINVNLRAPYLLTRACRSLFRPGGSIINIASTRALMSEAGTQPYSASKGGMLGLTHSLAVTLAPQKVRVNAILPGWIDTSLWQGKKNNALKLRKIDHEQHPAGRVGKPGDIAQACLFLADPEKSGFITGTTLVVDGGMTVKMIYVEDEK